jgi:hypothetical protein
VTAPEGPDPALSRLLRWYPRAWRERYGDEFLATIEDVLDGGTPTLRLRLSVAWAGLGERGHQVRRTGKAAARRLHAGRNGTNWPLLRPAAGYILALLPLDLRASAPPARGWQVTSALNAELGFAAFALGAIVASALLAVPAFGRFLRAGGWPRIRRRVGWAAAVTVAAGGALCWIAIASATKTSDQQLNVPLNLFLGIIVAGALFAVVLGLWADAAKRTAHNLGLSHRVRATETVLVAVSATAAFMMVSASMLFTAAIQSSAAQLLVCIAGSVALTFLATRNLRRAVRKGRRQWSASSRA